RLEDDGRPVVRAMFGRRLVFERAGNPVALDADNHAPFVKPPFPRPVRRPMLLGADDPNLVRHWGLDAAGREGPLSRAPLRRRVSAPPHGSRGKLEMPCR